MTVPSLPHPFQDDVDQPASGEQVIENLEALRKVLDPNEPGGGVALDNLSSSLITALSAAGAGGRGKAITATEESRTNTVPGILTTPDQVSGLVVPSGALLLVRYRAQIKSSVNNAGTVGLYLNGTLVAPQNALGVPMAVATSGTNTYWLAATSNVNSLGPTTKKLDLLNLAPDASLPNEVGDVVAFDLPAGTYTVSARYSATSGSITAKNRGLWAWVEAF